MINQEFQKMKIEALELRLKSRYESEVLEMITLRESQLKRAQHMDKNEK